MRRGQVENRHSNVGLPRESHSVTGIGGPAGAGLAPALLLASCLPCELPCSSRSDSEVPHALRILRSS